MMLKEECSRIGSVYESSMQDFHVDKEYNCIVLRYVTGYLDDKELIEFLSRLGNLLAESNEKARRMCQRESFVIVQDQVYQEGVSNSGEFGQRVRSEKSIEAIFFRTNLEVAKMHGPECFNEKYHNVKFWALGLCDI